MASVYRYDHKDSGQGLFRATAESTFEYLKELKNNPSYRGMKSVEMVKEMEVGSPLITLRQLVEKDKKD